LEAGDGTQALTTIREHKEQIALALLDVTIPGAPSRQVLAELRRARPQAKIIITSAYGPNTVDKTFAGMETDFFLRKPYEFADLIRVMRTVMSA
jgi:two-component system, cell cycle sensor histidine kinase and response regulator CckA